MIQQQFDRCGDCHSCCKSFSDIGGGDDPRLISALDITYEYDRCSQLNSDNRCNIYEKRPKTCSAFECLYLESDLPEKYIPRDIGFVTNVRGNYGFGINLQITPHQSKSRDLNVDVWVEENIEHIKVMKDTAEDMWGMPIDKIAVSCYNGDKIFEL